MANTKTKKEEVKDKSAEPVETKTAPVVEKNKIVLKSAAGKVVSEVDYFFGGKIPSGFVGTCGKPVDREDLLEVFHKVFRPEDDFLFYKAVDKEVYIIVPPIKYSTTIGESNNSMEGDFQKHAISFLNEGSVNLDTLRMKLNRIPRFCNFKDR